MFNDKQVKIDNKKIVLFTGIASSTKIKDYVSSKAELCEHFEFRDHYHYKKRDILKIIDCFKKIDSEEKLILTTEKDAARLGLFENYFDGLPVAFLPIEVKFQGKTNFNDLILKYVEQNRIDNKVS